jgi:hypothetical protein
MLLEINGRIYYKIAEPVPKRKRGISPRNYLWGIDFFLKK